MPLNKQLCIDESRFGFIYALTNLKGVLMKIIPPSYQILNDHTEDEILKKIELAARLCYKSEHKIAQGTAKTLIKALIKSGHHSVLEHEAISVKIICDRGVSHELVRHRVGVAYSQESTRYANYSKEQFGSEITVIDPCFWQPGTRQYGEWVQAMENAERHYLELIDLGATAQETRSVLPNSLKTEIVTTANIRSWRHIFSLRSSWINKKSHPQMIEIMDMIRSGFMERWPVFFGESSHKVILTTYVKNLHDGTILVEDVEDGTCYGVHPIQDLVADLKNGQRKYRVHAK